MRPLALDPGEADKRPYWLWDEDLSVAEVRARLAGPDRLERRRLLTKLLREARDTDVWDYVTPQEVADELADVAPRLGRRRRFWEWLIQGWRDDGYLA